MTFLRIVKIFGPESFGKARTTLVTERYASPRAFRLTSSLRLDPTEKEGCIWLAII